MESYNELETTPRFRREEVFADKAYTFMIRRRPYDPPSLSADNPGPGTYNIPMERSSDIRQPKWAFSQTPFVNTPHKTVKSRKVILKKDIEFAPR